MSLKLNAKQLRKISNLKTQNSKLIKNEIYIVLDNVLDTYNVGAIFRLADAVAAKRLYLCDKTEIPPNHKIKKASINTTEWVNWSYKDSPLEAIKELKKESPNIQFIVIEQTTGSIQYDKFEYKLPICLVVGNETYGVSKEVLEMADGVVEIPMYGVNISLNVMVSLGIVLYEVMEKFNS